MRMAVSCCSFYVLRTWYLSADSVFFFFLRFFFALVGVNFDDAPSDCACVLQCAVYSVQYIHLFFAEGLAVFVCVFFFWFTIYPYMGAFSRCVLCVGCCGGFTVFQSALVFVSSYICFISPWGRTVDRSGAHERDAEKRRHRG